MATMKELHEEWVKEREIIAQNKRIKGRRIRQLYKNLAEKEKRNKEQANEKDN